MRVVIRSGEPVLIADNEDMHLARNELHINDIYAQGLGRFTVFRVLTDDNQLFGAAIEESRPLHEKMALGQVVVQRAATADPHQGRFVLREVDEQQGLTQNA